MMTLLLLCMSSPSLVSVFKDVELSSQFGDDVLRAYCKSGTYGDETFWPRMVYRILKMLYVFFF